MRGSVWRIASVVGLLLTTSSLFADDVEETRHFRLLVTPVMSQETYESPFLKAHPAESLLVRTLALEAMTKTISRFGHLGREDETAAYFHFYWAGLATLELHQSEGGDWINTDPPSLYYLLNPQSEETGNSRMNLDNELAGFQAAARLSKAKTLTRASLEKEGDKLLSQGKLTVIEKQGTP